MGYSYLAVNGAALSAIITILQRDLGNVPNGSNTWGDGFFYETGREQADGSITGTVWAPVADKPGYSRKAGGIKIDDGKVIRFPGTTAAQREEANKAAAEDSRLAHGVGSGGNLTW